MCGLHLYLTGLIPGTVPYPTSSTTGDARKVVGWRRGFEPEAAAIRRIRGNCISYQTPQQTLHLHGNQPVSDLGHQAQGSITPISIQHLSTRLIFGQMPGWVIYVHVLCCTVPSTACIGDCLWMTSGVRIPNQRMAVIELQKGAFNRKN